MCVPMEAAEHRWRSFRAEDMTLGLPRFPVFIVLSLDAVGHCQVAGVIALALWTFILLMEDMPCVLHSTATKLILELTRRTICSSTRS